MTAYKNTSNSIKTFYGVTFKPGETHEVPGYINAVYMVRVNKPKEPPKVSTCKSQPKSVESKVPAKLNKQDKPESKDKTEKEKSIQTNLKEEKKEDIFNGTDDN